MDEHRRHRASRWTLEDSTLRYRCLRSPPRRPGQCRRVPAAVKTQALRGSRHLSPSGASGGRSAGESDRQTESSHLRPRSARGQGDHVRVHRDSERRSVSRGAWLTPQRPLGDRPTVSCSQHQTSVFSTPDPLSRRHTHQPDADAAPASRGLQGRHRCSRTVAACGTSRSDSSRSSTSRRENPWNPCCSTPLVIADHPRPAWLSPRSSAAQQRRAVPEPTRRPWAASASAR